MGTFKEESNSHNHCRRLICCIYLLAKMSVSLYGNVFSSVDMTNTIVLREVAKSGNLKKAEKNKIVKAIDKLEKEDEKK